MSSARAEAFERYLAALEAYYAVRYGQAEGDLPALRARLQEAYAAWVPFRG